MSNKIKCLFGKHDIKFRTEDESSISGGEWRCTICNLSFTVYDGDDRFGLFVVDHGPDFSKHPYFYEMPEGAILVSNVPLTNEDIVVLDRYLDEYWEEDDKKRAAEREQRKQ